MSDSREQTKSNRLTFATDKGRYSVLSPATLKGSKNSKLEYDIKCSKYTILNLTTHQFSIKYLLELINQNLH